MTKNVLIEKDRVVKIEGIRENTLLFKDVSKIYVKKFKSDLEEWKEEFPSLGLFSNMAPVWMLLLLRFCFTAFLAGSEVS